MDNSNHFAILSSFESGTVTFEDDGICIGY